MDRHIPAAATPAVLAILVLAGCSSLPAPSQTAGPTVTIRNEGERPLDLSYRCAEFGPVRRLGVVPPRASDTFTVMPTHCGTLHLVHRPLAGVMQHDAAPFAVVPLFGQPSVELIFANTGLLMRR